MEPGDFPEATCDSPRISPGASAPGYRDVAQGAIRFREATFR